MITGKLMKKKPHRGTEYFLLLSPNFILMFVWKLLELAGELKFPCKKNKNPNQQTRTTILIKNR